MSRREEQEDLYPNLWNKTGCVLVDGEGFVYLLTQRSAGSRTEEGGWLLVMLGGTQHCPGPSYGMDKLDDMAQLEDRVAGMREVARLGVSCDYQYPTYTPVGARDDD